MSEPHEPHERLDRAMRARGLELKKRWVDISRETGISTAALGAFRRGEYRPSPHTAQAIDAAYHWELGSVERILAGGEPVPASERGFEPSPLGKLIEDARLQVGPKSWPEAEEAAIVDDWLRLLQVDEPEGRDSSALARMSHVVGLAPSQVEAAGYGDVARRMRKLREGEGTARVVKPASSYRDEPTEEIEAAIDGFEPGSIRDRVEELIRRRKLRQLDKALSLVEDLDDDGHRDAG